MPTLTTSRKTAGRPSTTVDKRAEHKGGPVAFDPADYGTLVAHLASRLETAYADDDPVGTITDQGANGYDFTAAGALRPLYKTNIVNGHAVYRCDGVDDEATNTTKANWRFLHDGTGSTVFIVSKSASADHEKLMGVMGNNQFSVSKTGFSWCHEDRASASHNDTFYTVVGTAASSPDWNEYGPNGSMTTNTWAIACVTFGPSGGNHQTKTYINNTEQQEMTQSTTPDTGDATHDLAIGSPGNSPGGFFFAGDIAEIIMYSEVLSAANRTSVHDKLNALFL